MKAARLYLSHPFTGKRENFATTLCDTQVLDGAERHNRRKTYPLCDEGMISSEKAIRRQRAKGERSRSAITTLPMLLCAAGGRRFRRRSCLRGGVLPLRIDKIKELIDRISRRRARGILVEHDRIYNQ